MARPRKIGLDYWSCDTDIWESDAIKMLLVKLQSRGVQILMRLLSDIYRHGYYIQWDERKRISMMYSLTADVTQDDLDWAVRNLLEIGLFDKAMYDEHGILTSRNIQKRYFMAVGRRNLDKEDAKYRYETRKECKGKEKLMYTETPVNVDNNSVNVDENPGLCIQKSSSFSPLHPPILSKQKKTKNPLNPPNESGEDGEDEFLTSEEMSKYEEALASLSQEARKRSERLGEALDYLGVPVGIQHRLQAKSRFGMEGDPIWKYIADLKSSESKMRTIKNKGAYLCTCMGI